MCGLVPRNADGPVRSVALARPISKPYESAAAPTPVLNPAQPWTSKTTLTVFGLSLALLAVAYAIGRVVGPKVDEMRDRRTKKEARAWILTLISSVVCGAHGVFFLGRVIKYGFGHEFSREAKPWRTEARALFFLAYCIADLATGALDYIDEIDYQSGWAHLTRFMGSGYVCYCIGSTRTSSWQV